MMPTTIPPGWRHKYSKADLYKLAKHNRFVVRIKYSLRSRFKNEFLQYYADTKAQAEKMRAFIRESMDKDVIPFNDLQRFEEWLDLWLDRFIEPGSLDKWREYQGIVETYIKPKVGRIAIRKLTGGDFTEIIHRAFRMGLPEDEVARIRSICIKSMQDAVDNGVAVNNVAELGKFTRPREEPAVEEEWTTRYLRERGVLEDYREWMEGRKEAARNAR